MAKTSMIMRERKRAKLVKKYGGKVIVFGPNGVNRNSFVFNEHRANIIAALNDGAKAVTDLGLTAALHPHTGTCIETRDETLTIDGDLAVVWGLQHTSGRRDGTPVAWWRARSVTTAPCSATPT